MNVSVFEGIVNLFVESLFDLFTQHVNVSFINVSTLLN